MVKARSAQSYLSGIFGLPTVRYRGCGDSMKLFDARLPYETFSEMITTSITKKEMHFNFFVFVDIY
jgi:hypothetical protein